MTTNYREMTYQDLERVNAKIKTTPIKGKDYAEVNQRVMAFRMLYPTGRITTDIVKDEGGEVTFVATISVHDDFGNPIVIATGTAREKEGSSRINATSHVENAETSAVGRALGFCGIGIDTSIASFEEVEHAVAQQEEKEEKKATPKQIDFIESAYSAPEDMERLLAHFNVTSVGQLSVYQASNIISNLKGER